MKVMARRARKTPLEKYQEELNEVQESIQQYENCLETLQEREKELQEQIMMEKFKEVNELLEMQNMSLDDLKGMLIAEGGSAEIA
jgi:DNA repair exonuclease SbcCD ATPase subunit